MKMQIMTIDDVRKDATEKDTGATEVAVMCNYLRALGPVLILGLKASEKVRENTDAPIQRTARRGPKPPVNIPENDEDADKFATEEQLAKVASYADVQLVRTFSAPQRITLDYNYRLSTYSGRMTVDGDDVNAYKTQSTLLLYCFNGDKPDRVLGCWIPKKPDDADAKRTKRTSFLSRVLPYKFFLEAKGITGIDLSLDYDEHGFPLAGAPKVDGLTVFNSMEELEQSIEDALAEAADEDIIVSGDEEAVDDDEDVEPEDEPVDEPKVLPKAVAHKKRRKQIPVSSDEEDEEVAPAPAVKKGKKSIKQRKGVVRPPASSGTDEDDIEAVAEADDDFDFKDMTKKDKKRKVAVSEVLSDGDDFEDAPARLSKKCNKIRRKDDGSDDEEEKPKKHGKKPANKMTKRNDDDDDSLPVPTKRSDKKSTKRNEEEEDFDQQESDLGEVLVDGDDDDDAPDEEFDA